MTVTAQNQVSFKLHNGVIMPGLGFGTFASDAGSPRESYDAVRHALATGYRHMDCAWFYGNEAEVGEAVRDFLAENPSVKRSDIFITTKVWNHRHEPEAVKANLETALKQFGLDYVDMYMVHWPIAAESQPDDGTPRGGEPKLGADGKYIINKELTENPEPTWRAMEELYDAGKTKAIGVSNWTVDGLKQLLSFARVKPHANQIECHPFLPNDELVEFCKAHDVLPVAYSPLGSQDQVPSTGERVRDNAVLNKVAEERGFTLAQVLLAWGLKRGCAVLPKSGNPGRIQSNFQIPRLDDEGFQAINGVAKGRHIRFVNMKDTFGYNVWPEEPGFEGL